MLRELALEYVVKASIAAGLVGSLLLGIHLYNDHQQSIGEARGAAKVRAAWDADKTARAEADARLRAELQEKKNEAEAKDAKAAQVDNANRAITVNTNRVLNTTVQTLVSKLGRDSGEANSKYAAALGTVFGECRDALSAMEQNASGHARDSLKFDREWPTKSAKMIQ